MTTNPYFWSAVIAASIMAVVLFALHDSLTQRITSWHRRKWSEAGRPRHRDLLDDHFDLLPRRTRRSWIEDPVVVWNEEEEKESSTRG
jgi:hypothetical protein